MHVAPHQLACRVERLAITQQQIAKATGISQSQVSRILSGATRNQSKAYRRVCVYVERFERTNGPDPAKNSEIMDALRSTWDGTEPHAKLLARILKDLGELRLP